jgi:2-polyprenyl-6-methoxyphenol hydroxylase-like FAD-dependent oxidoreductase
VEQTGLRLETQRKIAGIDRSWAHLKLVTAAGETLGPFDLVVDALGSRSPLMGEASAPVRRRPLAYGALWTTLPWQPRRFLDFALEQRYERASVMIGVLPVGKRFPGDAPQTTFFWSLKTQDYEAWRSAGLKTWKAKVQRYWPETAELLDGISDPEQMILAGYGHHTLPLPYGEHIAFVGDSAHATSPQLGQGANMALMDVMALAHAMETTSTIAEALQAYAKARRFHVRLYQAMSAVFTPFYQSDSALLPVFRDWLVAPMTRIPGAPRLLANIVAGRLGS